MPSAYTGRGSDQFATEIQAWTASHLAPPESATEQARHGWLKEQVRLTRAYLESCRAYPDIDKALDIISGNYTQASVQNKSSVRINRIKRQVREIVATISDLRLIGEFKTENRAFFQHLEQLKKLYIGWYNRKFIRKALRSTFQYVAVEGTGYASARWESFIGNIGGKGDIVLDSYGATGVLPHQMGRDHNLQEAYACTLYNETPLHKVIATYPEFKDVIKPSRNSPLYTKSPMQTIQKFLSPVLSLFGLGQPKNSEATPFPMVDVYQTYIKDLSINNTGKTIAMGDPGTSWYYEVPSLNADLPTNDRDAQGNILYRKASYADAMLYPMRRLIVWSDTAIFYDGTSKYWHAQVPAIKFVMDDWPWEPLGYSLVRDNAPLQDTIVSIIRYIADNARARMNPPIGYSRSIDTALATRLDPTQPGQRIQLDETQGETMKPLLDPQYYDIPHWILEFIKLLVDTMDHQMGIADMMAFAKSKKQAPGADTLQQILEQVGPLVKDIAANIESSIEELVYQVMCLMFQFYTTRRRIEMGGDDSVSEQEFDFDPQNLIPSHLPNEDTAKPSMVGLFERAKLHMSQFWFYVEPGSLLNLTGMTKQLMLFQARKLGLWISQWTLFKAMGLPFAPEPEGATDEIGRYQAEQRLMISFKEELESAMAASKQGGAGRPQTFQEPPKQVQKTDGSVITRTSK